MTGANKIIWGVRSSTAPLSLAPGLLLSPSLSLSWQVSWWTARGCRQCGLFRCSDGRPQIGVAAAIDFDSISLPYSSHKIWPTVSDPRLPAWCQVKLHFPGPSPVTAAQIELHLQFHFVFSPPHWRTLRHGDTETEFSSESMTGKPAAASAAAAAAFSQNVMQAISPRPGSISLLNS